MVTTGTSFFYEAMIGGQGSGASMPVLVTNKHVVNGATNGFIRLLRAEGGLPKLGSSVNLTFTEGDFVGHPNPLVDVAAVALGGALTTLANSGTPVFYRVLGRDLVPSPEVVDELDVVEPVTFVGYPNALFDSVNLTPIVRRGTTATPVQLDYCGVPQFLIDASIFPGSSGSPVFLINEGGYRQGGSYMVGASRVLFLGVVAAVHQQASTGRIVTSTAPAIKFDQMIDLGVVFKWSVVDETVDELFRQRGASRQYVAPSSA
jgi:S1-C subfamily serine protease